MAESEKQSFVLYFDAYPSVEELPPDQRGELFSALYQYAHRRGGGHRQPGHGALPAIRTWLRRPGWPSPSWAGAVQRDTDKWRAKHQRYREAALRRHREAGGKPAGDDAWRYVEDPPAPVPGE